MKRPVLKFKVRFYLAVDEGFKGLGVNSKTTPLLLNNKNFIIYIVVTMLRFIRQRLQKFFICESGQTAAEYGILMWFAVFIGTVTLLTFLFAFEQALIGYYEDIVNIIALPLP